MFHALQICNGRLFLCHVLIWYLKLETDFSCFIVSGSSSYVFSVSDEKWKLSLKNVQYLFILEQIYFWNLNVFSKNRIHSTVQIK